jgi:hypothetical protein
MKQLKALTDFYRILKTMNSLFRLYLLEIWQETTKAQLMKGRRGRGTRINKNPYKSHLSRWGILSTQFTSRVFYFITIHNKWKETPNTTHQKNRQCITIILQKLTIIIIIIYLLTAIGLSPGGSTLVPQLVDTLLTFFGAWRTCYRFPYPQLEARMPTTPIPYWSSSLNRSSRGSNKKIIYDLTKCYSIFPSYLIHSEEK